MRATFQANIRSRHWSSVGCRFVTTRQSAGAIGLRSEVCISRPLPTRLTSICGVGAPPAISSTRTFFFACSAASAAGS